MTPQEQAAFDAMREALKHGIKWLNLRGEAIECMPLHEALAAANAVSEQPQAQEPVAWFAFGDSNGPVTLELFGWDEKTCKYAVLDNARSVGWRGTLDGYLYQQGWTIKPVYTAPSIELVQQPQARKPLTDEQDRALCEAHCNTASDEYFRARPALDFPELRRIFYAGHRKAWIGKDQMVETAHGIKE